MIKNLSQLKKALKANPRLEITGHCQSDYVGQVRRVTLANSVGFYSVMDGQPAILDANSTTKYVRPA